MIVGGTCPLLLCVWEASNKLAPKIYNFFKAYKRLFIPIITKAIWHILRLP